MNQDPRFQTSLRGLISQNLDSLGWLRDSESLGGPFTAIECAIWFCVQGYTVSVTNNILSQDISQIYSKARWTSDVVVIDGLPETPGGTALTSESPIHVDRTYGVSVSALDGLATGIRHLIFGVVEELPGGYRYSGSTFLPAFYQSDSVEHVLGNLATSLTNHIRQSGSSATKKRNS